MSWSHGIAILLNLAGLCALVYFCLHLRSMVMGFSKLNRDGRTPAQALSTTIRRGQKLDYITNDRVLTDALIIEGTALVDESVLTGESAPVLREPLEGRNTLLEGSRIVSGRLFAQVTREPKPANRFSADTAFRPLKKLHWSYWLWKTSRRSYAFALLISLTVLIFLNASMFARLSMALFSLLLLLLPLLLRAYYEKLIYSAAFDRLFHRHLFVSSIETLDLGGAITHFVRSAPTLQKAPAKFVVEDCVVAEDSTRESLLRAAQWIAAGNDRAEMRDLMIYLKRQIGFQPIDLSVNSVQFLRAEDGESLSGVLIYNSDGEDGLRTIMMGPLNAMKKHLEGLGHQVPAAIETFYRDYSKDGDRCLLITEGPRVLGLFHFRSHTAADIFDARWQRIGIKVEQGDAKRELVSHFQSLGGHPSLELRTEDDVRIAGLADLTLAVASESSDSIEADVLSSNGSPTPFIHFFAIAKELKIAKRQIALVSATNFTLIAVGIVIAFAFSSLSFTLDFWLILLGLMVATVSIFLATGKTVAKFHRGRGSYNHFGKQLEGL